MSFRHHYPMAAACAPSRASLLTGQYPSLHGVTQTDGIAKSADGDDMFWLAPDTVPTLGDWFRAGGYRTFFKGKWHASHAHLDAEDGEGFLLSIDDDGTPIEENIEQYLKADLLDDYGFSEWVGPEPHGLGKHNTGTVKDPFTADETIALLKRLDADGDDEPWLTVCSFLNPHDDSLFGVIALAQGLRYHPSRVPHVDQAPTHEEDLSTKPSCQQSMVDTWGKLLAPQPWIETHLKFYYQMQAAVGEQITRVLDALRDSDAYENTIVVFSSDHGDMQGAHGGMHEKWHVAYEEALHVPFIVSSPLLPGGARELDIPTNHADLIPTLLGLAGIDHDQALARLQRRPHRSPRRSSGATSQTRSAPPSPPRRRSRSCSPPTTRSARAACRPRARSSASRASSHVYATVKQPNHLQTVIAEVDVDGEQHLVKFSRYYDNAQFWTVPGERDERLHGRHTDTVTEPEPDEYELYDLTLDPTRGAQPRAPRERRRRARARCSRRCSRLLTDAARRQAPHPVSRRGPRLPPAGERLTALTQDCGGAGASGPRVR